MASAGDTIDTIEMDSVLSSSTAGGGGSGAGGLYSKHMQPSTSSGQQHQQHIQHLQQHHHQQQQQSRRERLTTTTSDEDDRDKASEDRAASLDINGGEGSSSFGAAGSRLAGSSGTAGKDAANIGSYKYDRERKLGHRRIGESGQVTYKKIETTQLMGSIQLGIQYSVGSLASKPKRDLLMLDFFELEAISFPPEGSTQAPAHHYSEFKFKIYAPTAFRFFRHLFGIQPDDFMMSMCSAPLRELSNPGASGSIFYLTGDDEFIIKTVQHKEGEFLQKLLPGYYLNLSQNPRTLLPKFFGLYCFQCNSKNIRLIVMNNLLPSYVKMHLKYDLKGSTYNRKASKAERGKKSPTYKDLDFMEQHPNGILLEADTYNALVKTIQRDCRVLESFKIMDYSLLVGVHNLDLALQEKKAERENPQPQAPQTPQTPRSGVGQAAGGGADDESDLEDAPEADQFIAHERDREERERGATALNRSRSINRQRLVAHSTAMESIQAESEPIDEEEDVPPGGIPARSDKGERLLLFIGIIDILQSYRLKKRLEHTFKSIIHDGDTVSVCRPSFYAQRFQNFMAKTVFKKIPSLDLPEIKGNHRKFRTLVSSYIALKHSPSKRKSLSKTAQQRSQDVADSDAHPVAGASGGAGTSSSQSTSNQHHNNVAAAPIAGGSGQASGSGFSFAGPSTSKAAAYTAAATVHSSAAASASVNIGADQSAAPTKSTATIAPSQQLQQQQQQQKGNTLPPLKQKTGIVKSKVPPPVPPRGSPKERRGGGSGGSSSGSRNRSSSSGSRVVAAQKPTSAAAAAAGTAPSCSSTPPPPFDDISEGSNSIHRHQTLMQQYPTLSRRGFAYREDTVSISEIRLDPHLAIDTSVGSGSHYGSGNVLSSWTPPASVEGSTPTFTEGTPSFTESSSSGEMAFSGNSSPLNTAATDRHKPTVEEALNSLTSEMPQFAQIENPTTTTTTTTATPTPTPPTQTTTTTTPNIAITTTTATSSSSTTTTPTKSASPFRFTSRIFWWQSSA